MSKAKSVQPVDDPLTPTEMLDWLRREASDVSKAAEMRIREATHLATAYAMGEINSQEAMERHNAYARRWGDAIRGVGTSEGKTEKQIRKEMDEARDGTWQRKMEARSRRGQGPSSPG